MKNIVAFCGGRGSESFIKAWNLSQNNNLSLVINAYDDGLSTGRIRDYIPQFLGPSDFRKNIVHYLYSCSDEFKLEIAKILEKRIESKAELIKILDNLEKKVTTPYVGRVYASFIKSINEFLAYEKENVSDFDYSDCAFGNLILAGFYLQNDFDFQRAIDQALNIMEINCQLLTASNENNISLIATTTENEFLGKESLIVNGLYRGSINRLGFMNSDLLHSENAFISGIKSEVEIRKILEKCIVPKPNSKAEKNIISSDILCFLPGTQNSSLFPSYLILHKAIKESKASIKVLVLNLNRDLDMANWQRSDILKNALKNMGDPNNQSRCITHVLINSPSIDSSLLDGPIIELCKQLNILLIPTALLNAQQPNLHSGEILLSTILSL